MDALNREQLDQLAEDIAFVKKAIEKNSSIVQRIDFRSSLRLMTLLTALAIFFFCGLFYALNKHFGCFADIPLSIKAIVFSVIASIGIGLGFLKNSGLLKSARAVEPGISLMRLFREYFSIRIYRHFIPMGVVLVFSCLYATATGNSRFVIPLCSIGAGLVYTTFDAMLGLKEFLRTSYWFIVTGCVVFVFNTISPLLSLCLTLGCGLLLLSAMWYVPKKKRAEA
jgi:magnesium-transporting ATPase (P-type)